jgi:hypothetical protein
MKEKENVRQWRTVRYEHFSICPQCSVFSSKTASFFELFQRNNISQQILFQKAMLMEMDLLKWLLFYSKCSLHLVPVFSNQKRRPKSQHISNKTTNILLFIKLNYLNIKRFGWHFGNVWEKFTRANCWTNRPQWQLLFATTTYFTSTSLLSVVVFFISGVP